MKVSELIGGLQRMQEAYGDIPVTITISFSPTEIRPEIKEGDGNAVVHSSDLHLGYDQYKEGDEINIRSFPY